MWFQFHRWIPFLVIALFTSFLYVIQSSAAPLHSSLLPHPLDLIDPPQAGTQGGSQPWTCWDDGTLDPCHATLYAIDGTAADNIWAVGESGRLFRYDGSIWSRFDFPSASNIYDVEVLAPDNIWVSTNALWHWNGSDWEYSNSILRSPLGLSMVSDTDGWTVGYEGEIHHWNGTELMSVTSPVTTALIGIQMLSANDGWAVGANGVILRYNGSEWAVVPSPTTNTLHTLQMVSPTEGYAVGYNDFLIWNGSTWNIAPYPSSAVFGLSGMTMLSPTLGYVSSYRHIDEWDGITWTRVYTSTDFDLGPMFGADPDHLFSVGAAGTIAHGSSTGWEMVNNPEPEILYAIDALSPTTVWAGGYNDTLRHYDGTTWQTATYTPLAGEGTARSINGLMLRTDTDGWAVGSNLLIRWDGNSWTEVERGTTTYYGYEDVAAVAENDVWVVGENNQSPRTSVIRHWNGSTWTEVSHPTASILRTVVMLDADTGMAGGYWYNSSTGIYESVLLQWNGTMWSEIAIPDIGTISDIVLEDITNGWIVGDSRSLRLQAGTFTEEPNAGGTSAAFASPDNGWITGYYGYHWNGTMWSYDQYFDQALNDAVLFEDGTGWAVGEDGVVYRLQPPLTTYLPLIKSME